MAFTTKENVKASSQKPEHNISFETILTTTKELWNDKGTIKNNYAVDFVKSLLTLTKLPITVYLLIEFLFVFIGLTILFKIIFSVLNSTVEISTTVLGLVSFVVYFGSIVISLSSLGEAILRFMNGVEEITSPEILSRLEPLFNEVYAKAKANFPDKVSKNIKLYIQRNEDPNAFAMGRNSVTVTTGLLELPDEQIKAILGHEFGHLAHKDTDLLLVLNITSKFVHLLFVGVSLLIMVYKLVVKVITLVLSFLDRSGRIYRLIDKLSELALTAVKFVFVTLVEDVWNIIGNLLLSISSHEGEFLADKFALDLGYGEYLVAFFKTLPDERKLGLFEKLKSLTIVGSTHPETWKRIEKLQAELNKGAKITATISESTNENDSFDVISE